MPHPKPLRPLDPQRVPSAGQQFYMEWSIGRPKPKNVTPTHFQTLMAENLRRRAFRLLTARHPNLKNLS